MIRDHEQGIGLRGPAWWRRAGDRGRGGVARYWRSEREVGGVVVGVLAALARANIRELGCHRRRRCALGTIRAPPRHEVEDGRPRDAANDRGCGVDQCHLADGRGHEDRAHGIRRRQRVAAAREVALLDEVVPARRDAAGERRHHPRISDCLRELHGPPVDRHGDIRAVVEFDERMAEATPPAAATPGRVDLADRDRLQTLPRRGSGERGPRGSRSQQEGRGEHAKLRLHGRPRG